MQGTGSFLSVCTVFSRQAAQPVFIFSLLAPRQRNREHARRSRLKKKHLGETLLEASEILKKQNAMLRNEMYSLIGKDNTDTLVKEIMDRPLLQFIETLKLPQNRIVDKKTAKLLSSFRSTLPSKIGKNEE